MDNREIRGEAPKLMSVGVERMDAQTMVDNFMGHSYALLDTFFYQNTEDLKELKEVGKIHKEAKKELDRVKATMEEMLQTKTKVPLSKENVDYAKELMKFAEKYIGGLFANIQVKMAEEIGIVKTPNMHGNEETAIRSHLKALIKEKGNWWVQIKAFFRDSTAIKAIEAFEAAKIHMEAAAKKTFDHSESIPQVEKDKVALQTARFKGTLNPLQKEELTRRVGVVGFNNIYRIAVSFDKKHVAKQLRSFIAQRQSDQERAVIKKEIITGNQIFTSELIPLNVHFDTYLKQKNAELHTNEFGKIFGKKGVSALERQGHHLVNAYHSRLLTDQGQVAYDVLRHGVLSVGKNVVNVSQETRKATAKQAALELVKAALLKQIADSGKPLDRYLADHPDKVLLQINSLSLLTPVMAQIARIAGQTPEIELLKDQLEAFENLKNSKEPIEINGQKIRLDLQINSFNFGVNAGAMWSAGSLYQHDMNLKALNGSGLKSDQVEPTSLLGQYIKAKEIVKNQPGKDVKQVAAEMDQLMDDILKMMSTDTSYLDGGNQYELAARIISLNHLMGFVFKKIGQSVPQLVFNCMSDKDRSGVMDSVGKAFAAMRRVNGRYPTREELDYKTLAELEKTVSTKEAQEKKLSREGKIGTKEWDSLQTEMRQLNKKREQLKEIQSQFAEILYDMLLQSGSLELIETNTGVRGYKVSNEANFPIFQHLIGEFSFIKIQGLGATTES